MNSKEARIIFMGTPEFAVETLRSLVENKYNVVAVVTVPDKPAGRGQKLHASAVKQYAVEHNLPVLQPVKLRDEDFLEELKSYKADLQIVVAFRMLPEAVWAMPPFKTFNLHASLLPNYRGAAPINWAIINGEKKSGVTTFFIQHNIDTGNVIDQREVEITPDMNIGELYGQLMHIGADLVTESVDNIFNGKVVPRQQDESIPIKPAPKIFKEDCKINWGLEAQQVHNLVRGLSPYPVAWTLLKNEDKEISVKIYKTLISEPSNAPVGEIRYTKNQLFVSTASHWLEVVELQLAGKRRMTAKDLLCGFDFNGYVFE